jgi:Family of unknown function (DUF6252)
LNRRYDLIDQKWDYPKRLWPRRMQHLLTSSYCYKAITAFCCLLLVLACKKDDLPKPTQTGADTLGCKVNGNSWIPNGSPGPTPLPPVDGGYQANPKYAVYIRAYKKRGGANEAIRIYLNNVTKPGTYSLNYDTGYDPQEVRPENHATYSTYYPDTFYGTTAQVGGTVTITRADTVAGIVSGTFSFTAVDKDGNQVKITSGRFDVSN